MSSMIVSVEFYVLWVTYKDEHRAFFLYGSRKAAESTGPWPGCKTRVDEFRVSIAGATGYPLIQRNPDEDQNPEIPLQAVAPEESCRSYRLPANELLPLSYKVDLEGSKLLEAQLYREARKALLLYTVGRVVAAANKGRYMEQALKILAAITSNEREV